MNPDSNEQLIESPTDALEAMKELFKREATFGCEKIKAGWLIVIFDPGRGYADDSAGQPSEIVYEEHLGRVLAAKRSLNQADEHPSPGESTL